MLLNCPIADVPIEHMSAIVRVESNAHPFAIGVVGGYLSRQPATKEEAMKTVKMLREQNRNFSVGLAQVNKTNFSKYSLTDENLFEPCANLLAGSKILKDCYEDYKDWEKAYSCYYSGNAITGFRHGYVRKVKEKYSMPVVTELLTLRAKDDEIYVINYGKGQGKPRVLTLAQRRLHARLN